MSAAARWYLAGIAMLGLVLIAMHFAMQVYTQQEVRRLVSSWAQASELSVGDVRYRMLRGALTLVDVRLNREQLQIYAPTVFLHGSLSALAGKEPQTTYIEIRGAHASLSAQAMEGMVQDGREPFHVLFHQLWDSAQRVGIYHSTLTLLPAAGALFPNKPTTIALTRLEASGAGDKKDMTGAVQWLDGEMIVATRLRWQNGLESDEGNIIWDGLDAAMLLQDTLGLTALSGRVHGKLAWKSTGHDKPSYAVTGKTEIENVAGGDGHAALEWSGTLAAGKWRGEMKSVAWPLAMFSNQLPAFQQYRLAAGNFDGNFNLSGRSSQWSMTMAASEISNMQYRRIALADDKLPDWRIAALHVEHATLRWPERTISAEKVAVNHASIVVDARGVAGDDRRWKLDIKAIDLSQLTPAIRLSDELFHLPLLAGSVSWRRGGQLRLHLQSAAPDQETASESWTVAGEGSLSAKSASPFKLEVTAQKAALVRFRPLLPEMLRRDASDMSGDVALNLHMLAGPGAWQGSGEASVANAGFQYHGEQWHAKAMQVGLEQIGVGLKEQEIGRIDVQGWHYQAALQPLNQPKPGHVVPAEEVTVEATKHAESWHVRELLLKEGLVTVGHADAAWLQNVSIHIEDLQPGSAAPLMARANLGGGSLALKGSLVWESVMPELQMAKLSVRDALPFFMNEWLAVSDMPELIRGRLYADISLQKESDGNYRGMGYFRLQHGVLGPALSRQDMLLSKVGFNTHDIFAALHKSGRIRLSVPLQGRGPVGDVIGDSLVRVLKRDMGKRSRVAKSATATAGKLLSSVRLHETGSLSRNERTRLRGVIRYLRKNPKRAIELKPRLNASPEEDGQVERARYTQQLVGNFLVNRGISRSRIFPVQPGEQHRSSSSTSGVGIVTIP